eukprot:3341086-Pleurochrysis_carterae.AAC.2
MMRVCIDDSRDSCRSATLDVKKRVSKCRILCTQCKCFKPRQQIAHAVSCKSDGGLTTTPDGL